MERVRACWVYSWWEPLPIRPHTLSPSTPWSPSRLSGRAADRLSDEMMTLLWEVIPKWKVSGKDDAPFSHPPLHSSPPPSCCQLRIVIDLLQMARRKHPLIFQCFIKKILIYSCITGAWTRLIPPVSKWGTLQKGMILPALLQDKWPAILFQKQVNKLSD